MSRIKNPIITSENIESLLYSKVEDEYTLLTPFVKYNIKVTMRHNSEKCNNHEWDIIANEFINRGRRCPKCSHRSYKKTTEEYKKQVFETVGDEYTILGEYSTKKVKILTRHNNESCDNYEWEVTPDSFMNRGRRCPKCSGHDRKDLKYFANRLKELLGDEYEVVGTEYINNRTPIKVKHLPCETIYGLTLTNLEKKNKCKLCSKHLVSENVRLIESFLDKNNIKYEREKKYDSCASFSNKTNRYYHLPFDFYLPEYDLLIEYDGEQHFKGYNKEQLKKQQKNDALKTNWCKENKKSLLRLTKFDKIGIEDSLYDLLISEGSTTIQKYNLLYYTE